MSRALAAGPCGQRDVGEAEAQESLNGEALMNSPNATTKEDAPPGARSLAYYVTWLQELSELRSGGLVEDEDCAFSRAERLEHLFEKSSRPWRKWLFFALPAALIVGVLAMLMTDNDTSMLAFAADVAVLCIFAALAMHSRADKQQISPAQRLEILRVLLERDLISSVEFSGFERRIGC